MSGSPLFWRLYAAYLALVMALSVGVGAWMQHDAREVALARHERELSFCAELLADVARPALEDHAGDGARAALVARLRELGRSGPARLTVIAEDGRVLADTDADPAAMDNHGERPEVLAARASGEGKAQRVSASLSKQTLYVALPIADGPRIAGFARAAMSVEDIERSLAPMRHALLWSAIGAALLGLGGGLFFARRLQQALEQMTRTARAISGGRYDAARPWARSPVVGPLATALDGMAQNLRERVEAVERDRNKVLAILGSMVEGVVAVDREQRLLHINEVAARLLRIAVDGAEGQRIWELTRVVEVCEILESAAGAHGELRGEARLPSERTDGTGASGRGPVPSASRILELRASALRDADGDAAGAVVVLHDVTELRRLEGVRRDFVANVSHELKTPLTAIRGLVETLIDDTSMPADTRARFLDKVRDQSERLSTLVADLLTLARIESQDTPFERRLLDLRGPLRECAARFTTACEAKGLTLSLQQAESPQPVLADDESVRQILDNLTDNAVKYTPAGGRIWLSVHTSTVPGEGEADEVVLEVRDTGIGIEPRDLERVFERFYRVDKARSRELGSTGLGLAIVKHLALSLEGRVSVESTTGHGSTFRVHLPRATLPS